MQLSDKNDKFHIIAVTETYIAYKGKFFYKYCVSQLFFHFIEERETCLLTLFYFSKAMGLQLGLIMANCFHHEKRAVHFSPNQCPVCRQNL